MKKILLLIMILELSMAMPFTYADEWEDTFGPGASERRADEIDRQFKADEEAQAERFRSNAPKPEQEKKALEELERLTGSKTGLDRGKQLREGTESVNKAQRTQEELKKNEAIRNASNDRTLNFYSGTASEAFTKKKSLFSIEGLKMQLLPSVAKWITGLLSALAVIFLMYAGIQYLTAGGEEEKITNATKTTFYVLIGVILMMFAYAIVYLFLTILA